MVNLVNFKKIYKVLFFNFSYFANRITKNPFYIQNLRVIININSLKNYCKLEWQRWSQINNLIRYCSIKKKKILQFFFALIQYSYFQNSYPYLFTIGQKLKFIYSRFLLIYFFV